MRQANWSPQSQLFRPTRDLRFSEAAVQALQSAEQRRRGNPFRVEIGRSSGWRWLWYCLAVYFVLHVITSALSRLNRMNAPDSFATVSEAPVTTTARIEDSADTARPTPMRRPPAGGDRSDPDSESDYAVPIRRPPATDDRSNPVSEKYAVPQPIRRAPAAVPRTSPVPKPPLRASAPPRQWMPAIAVGPLPLFESVARDAALRGWIPRGTAFWIIDTGMPCWLGGTWKRAHIPGTNSNVYQPTTGMICTVNHMRTMRAQGGR